MPVAAHCQGFNPNFYKDFFLFKTIYYNNIDSNCFKNKRKNIALL